jgi:hypothetical protein
MNESAFPTTATTRQGVEYHVPGMTLRDYFAAKAMQAILSRPVGEDEEDDNPFLARLAYDVADAMLMKRAP